VPVYLASGKQVGQATSSTWSPTLKKSLALAQIHREHTSVGTKLQIEHTVEFERRRVTATIVERPFFDPSRKTSTPNLPPKAPA
jgi:aminomethyltransferase